MRCQWRACTAIASTGALSAFVDLNTALKTLTPQLRWHTHGNTTRHDSLYERGGGRSGL